MTLFGREGRACIAVGVCAVLAACAATQRTPTYTVQSVTPEPPSQATPPPPPPPPYAVELAPQLGSSGGAEGPPPSRGTTATMVGLSGWYW